jgi:two-component system LytT family sensor kinase
MKSKNLNSKPILVIASLGMGFILALLLLSLEYFLIQNFSFLYKFIILSILATLSLLISLQTFRNKEETEQLRAKQSHQILEIANKTLPYLRRGLSFESASKVAEIILTHSDAVAVAITDRTTVMGFCGIGDEHHKVTRPILTRSTKEAIEHNRSQIVRTKEGIGCPATNCPLQGAIVVPLELRGQVAGALKFYYTDPAMITKNRITVAEGLAKLLSTQLELSEIDRQKELTCRAELRALQAQINPHFLFNTLNTIAMFCRTNPREARRLLIKFAAFFRKTLEWRDELVTLEQELNYINNYLDLEKARFGDNLVVSEEIDKAASNVKLPALTLQPLVENAIKHGFPKEGRLEIQITAKVSNSHLTLQVKDNGKGISQKEIKKVLGEGYGRGSGIGLTNVNERLKSLFGKQYGLKIKSNKGQGTQIEILIPLRGQNGN